MNRRAAEFALACAVLLSSLVPTPSASGAAAPRTPPSPDARTLARAEATVIDAAIADLKKEYAAYVKDPHGKPLRAQPTYFTDHPVRLSPESLLDALERPLGDDARVTAYVKWQLLSAAPDKFDVAMLPRVLSAYQAAPAPPPRFGLSADDRTKLDILLLKSRREDDAPISAKLDERVRRESEENHPVLAYRDALYARLPAGYESLVAGFRDAHERTLAGAGGGASDAHAARVVKDALAWAQSGTADAGQCERLRDLVSKLRFVRSPPYYARAGWRYDHLAWSSRTDSVYSAKKLADLEAVLRQAGEQAKAREAAEHAAQQSAQPAGQRTAKAPADRNARPAGANRK